MRRDETPSPAGGEDLVILGIGNDLCDIRRIEKTIDRYGERAKRARIHIGTPDDPGVRSFDLRLLGESESPTQRGRRPAGARQR